MKKLCLLLGIFCCTFVLNGCGNIKTITTSKEEDKFKTEYESLNGKEKEGTKYVSVSIPSQNRMVYPSFSELMDLFDHGTGVIYFGFPECPWCRNAVPVLIDAVKELGIEKIYYFNARDMRDTKVLNELGEVVTEKEGTKEYYQLLAALGNYADVYDGLNDEAIKRLYFPTVVVVKNGKIIGTHVSTVASQTDPTIPLKEEQKEELKEIYQTYLTKIANSMCGEAC